MRRLPKLTVIAAMAVLVASPLPASAQGAPYCRVGEQPAFRYGFATLKAQLGATMGDPVECEHPNSANGDTLQQTTTGLAFYRKSTNTPTFTDGYRHWGLTPSGLVAWQGSAVDPPGGTEQAGLVSPGYAAFAGTWWHHGFVFEMWEDGHAQAEWRTYQQCGPGVIGACDRVTGNMIVGGGQAYFQFDNIDGAQARGRVLSSTDLGTFRPGAVRFTLQPYGMAKLQQRDEDRILCGPRFLTEAPESVKTSLPCGA
jgi:hypothetical protein